MVIQKHKKQLRAGAALLMLFYSIVFVSHVFLLANITTTPIRPLAFLSSKSAANSAIQRTDKTVIDKKPVIQKLRIFSNLYISLFTGKASHTPIILPGYGQPQFLADLHYSYLVNRVIRI